MRRPRSLTAVILAAAMPLAAQQTQIFRADTSLILVPFHVARGDAYVTSLKAEDIVLMEGGAPRKFSVFEFTAVRL
jgi:hypothetical protein